MQIRQMVSAKIKVVAANAVQGFKNNPAVQRIKELQCQALTLFHVYNE